MDIWRVSYCIVTGGEMWAQHFELETQCQSMEWHHKCPPVKKELNTQQSSGMVMCSVFWDSHGVILVFFGEGDHYKF